MKAVKDDRAPVVRDGKVLDDAASIRQITGAKEQRPNGVILGLGRRRDVIPRGGANEGDGRVVKAEWGVVEDHAAVQRQRYPAIQDAVRDVDVASHPIVFAEFDIEFYGSSHKALVRSV